MRESERAGKCVCVHVCVCTRMCVRVRMCSHMCTCMHVSLYRVKCYSCPAPEHVKLVSCGNRCRQFMPSWSNKIFNLFVWNMVALHVLSMQKCFGMWMVHTGFVCCLDCTFWVSKMACRNVRGVTITSELYSINTPPQPTYRTWSFFLIFLWHCESNFGHNAHFLWDVA